MEEFKHGNLDILTIRETTQAAYAKVLGEVE